MVHARDGIPGPDRQTVRQWSSDQLMLYTAGLPSKGMESIPTGSELYPGTLAIHGPPEWTNGLYDFLPPVEGAPGVQFIRRAWTRNEVGPPEASLTFFTDGNVVFRCARFVVRGRGSLDSIHDIKWNDSRIPRRCWQWNGWMPHHGRSMVDTSTLLAFFSGTMTRSDWRTSKGWCLP